MSLEITRLMTDFVVNAKFDDFPLEVVCEAKKRLLDFLGVTLAGANRIESKIAYQTIMSLGGKEECIFIGHNKKGSCLNASLVNSITGHILELDDVNKRGIIHAGVVVFPAALAASERDKASGRQLIEAIILGYEVGIRIAEFLNPSHRFSGFHTTGTCGTFAAAVAAGKVFNLNKEEMINALGLAATQASGLLEFHNMSKRLNPGAAVYSGILSTLLAKNGFTGATDVLGKESKFIQAFSDGSNNPEIVVKDLGANYKILETDIKFHACCGFFHSALDALISIVKENEIHDLVKIEKITIQTFRAAIDGHNEYNPKSLVAATMSLPYNIAFTLLNHYRANKGENLRNNNNGIDPKVLEFIQKIELKHSDNIEKLFPKKWAADVYVTMKNGKTYKSYLDNPKGSYPGNVASDDEIKIKFENLVQGKFNINRIKEIENLVDNLERLEDINVLMEIFNLNS